MKKKILKFEDAREKIIRAVDMIADPVRQTMSPKGSNVLFEDANGSQIVSNDGVTIANHITSSDEIENAIIEVIKTSAQKTNTGAGDGTSTNILLTQNLIKSGMKLIDEGHNRMILKGKFERFGEKLKQRLSKLSINVHGDKDLMNIARISANNDNEIAENVVNIVKTAGLNGMVFIKPYHKTETEIVKDSGYKIDSGYYSPELCPQGSFSVSYENVPVLITDKKLYYAEEAETILKVAVKSGFKSIVIVAKDFIGQAPNYFIANHTKGIINVLLVKDSEATDKDTSSLSDLALYVDGKLITDKTGRLVNNIEAKDFVMVRKVFSDPTKTIIIPKNKPTKALKERIKAIETKKEETESDKKLEKRLSALTNGTVTVKVGGKTPIEVNEKIYRYEDAVNAVRAAMKDGYLVGGGLSILKAFVPEDHEEELRPLIRKYCEASIRQIAENCGEYPEYVLKNIDLKNNIGYNAVTSEFSNLLKDGVIDPYKVTEMAIDNSISVANMILTSGYIIVNEKEEKDEQKRHKN